MRKPLRFLKIGLSWVVVFLGIGLGIFILGVFGMRPVLGYSVSATEWLTNLAIAVFGATVLLASIISLRNRKRAASLCFRAVPIVAACLAPSDVVTLAQKAELLALPSAILIVLGLIWYGTYKLSWPGPIPEKVAASRVKPAAVAVAAFLGFILVSAAAIGVTVHAPYIGDCGESAPFARPKNREQVVSVARVIHVGSILGTVAIVQERFWGLPKYSRIVFLKAPGKPGDTYFVDGRLGEGLLTRYLTPVISMHCSRSALIQEATVDLRVLRDGPPKNGVRIIGQAVKINWGHGYHRDVVPGLKVVITGPNGSVVTATDSEGVYDVSGLVPGHYTVRADAYSERFRDYPHCRDREDLDLKQGDVWGCKLRID